MTAVDSLDEIAGYLRGARRCADPSSLAVFTVDHLRDVAAAEWSECVWSSARAPVEVLATSDEDLTRELMRARSSTEEPPRPEEAGERTVVIDDFAVSSPWPSFAEQARRTTSVRSAVLTYFSTADGGGVLTVIDPRPAHFDVLAQRRARIVADLFTLHLDRLHGGTRADQLTQAVTSGRRIGAACGMLAVQRGVSVDEAFGLLQAVSQRSHRKLRHVAEQVLADPELLGEDLGGGGGTGETRHRLP